MLRNAYIKYMCWLYYKFERILGRLGGDELPKILYDGTVSSYELQLLVILARAGRTSSCWSGRGTRATSAVTPRANMPSSIRPPV